MGIFGHPTYEKVIAGLYTRIAEQLTAGAEYARLASVGNGILHDHVPTSHVIGDSCPKCAGDAFPCKVIMIYANYPD